MKIKKKIFAPPLRRSSAVLQPERALWTGISIPQFETTYLWFLKFFRSDLTWLTASNRLAESRCPIPGRPLCFFFSQVFFGLTCHDWHDMIDSDFFQHSLRSWQAAATVILFSFGSECAARLDKTTHQSTFLSCFKFVNKCYKPEKHWTDSFFSGSVQVATWIW